MCQVKRRVTEVGIDFTEIARRRSREEYEALRERIGSYRIRYKRTRSAASTTGDNILPCIGCGHRAATIREFTIVLAHLLGTRNFKIACVICQWCSETSAEENSSSDEAESTEEGEEES
jgi:hypothetical protein